jgi:hypothetical protein
LKTLRGEGATTERDPHEALLLISRSGALLYNAHARAVSGGAFQQWLNCAARDCCCLYRPLVLTHSFKCMWQVPRFPYAPCPSAEQILCKGEKGRETWDRTVSSCERVVASVRGMPVSYGACPALNRIVRGHSTQAPSLSFLFITSASLRAQGALGCHRPYFLSFHI